MERRRERQVTGSAIGLLLITVVALLVSGANGDVLQWTVAFAVVSVALTLCAAITIMCIHLHQTHATQPISASSIAGQFALLAGSVALFGVLVTGVFIITAFRIQDTATGIATAVATDRFKDYDRQMGQEMSRFRQEYGRLAAQLDSRLAQQFRTRVQYLERRRATIVDQRGPDTESGVEEIDIHRVTSVQVPADQSRSFRFTVPRDGRYSIEATARSTGFDPYLYLYGDNRLRVVNDNGAGELNSRIEDDLREGTTYYVNSPR